MEHHHFPSLPLPSNHRHSVRPTPGLVRPYVRWRRIDVATLRMLRSWTPGSGTCTLYGMRIAHRMAESMAVT